MPSGLTKNVLVAVYRRAFLETVGAPGPLPQLGSATLRWYSQTYIFPPSAAGTTLVGGPNSLITSSMWWPVHSVNLAEAQPTAVSTAAARTSMKTAASRFRMETSCNGIVHQTCQRLAGSMKSEPHTPRLSVTSEGHNARKDTGGARLSWTPEDTAMTIKTPKARGSAACLAGLVLVLGASAPARAQEPSATRVITLPAPRATSEVSVEQVLKARRSLRSFAATPLTIAEVSQLLWAAQGVTDERGRRTAPSAGALYPLELFLVAGNVAGLPSGVYRYRPAEHDLVLVVPGDHRADVASACRQGWVAEPPASVAFAAVYARTAKKYGDRSARYVPIEVGAAAENLALQAVALGLGTTVVGAYDDAKLAATLGSAADEQPLVLLPVGRK
jgi:SagB-type dehydrogenase family enzyme